MTVLHVLAMVEIGAGVAVVTAPANGDEVSTIQPTRLRALLVLETFLSGFSTSWSQMSVESQ